MDIYPQDLSRKAQDELRRSRTPGAEAGPPVGPAARAILLQRARWIFFTLACWSAFASLLVFGLHVAVVYSVAVALFGALVGHYYIVFGWYLSHGIFPSRHRLSEKLSSAEVSLLKHCATDAVEERYCDLLSAALQIPPLPDNHTEEEIRRALKALGDAVEDLPQHDPEAIRDNSRDLIVSAAGLAVEADHESDSLIAESMRRRADALHRQADTVAWTAVAVRRSGFLRAEAVEQVEALRTGLVALSIGRSQGSHEPGDLATGIRDVAQAAAAIIAARSKVVDDLEQAHHRDSAGTA